MPHDPPSQAAWMERLGVNTYPAVKVANGVHSFLGYGVGGFGVFHQHVDIIAAGSSLRAIAVAIRRSRPAGIDLRRLCGASFLLVKRRTRLEVAASGSRKGQ
jgi:hypothetical protein